MRLTPLDYVQILFYVVLMLAVILVASHAIGVLDGIEKRQQQGTIHHNPFLGAPAFRPEGKERLPCKGNSLFFLV